MTLGSSMDTNVAAALERGGIADITTTGRKTGAPRRIEIYFHHFDGEHFLTGRPGFKRDWLANLSANPNFTVHLKRGVTADVPAVAEPITDIERRRSVLYRILTESWGEDPEKANATLDVWIEGARLVQFSVNGTSSTA